MSGCKDEDDRVSVSAYMRLLGGLTVAVVDVGAEPVSEHGLPLPGTAGGGLPVPEVGDLLGGACRAVDEVGGVGRHGWLVRV